jgi:hypothetical protein
MGTSVSPCTQVDAIRSGAFGTFMDFAKRYCNARRLPWVGFRVRV